jgi:ribosomal protein S27AE
MSEAKRWKCEKCGNENRQKIQEIDDKSQKALYYSMQGSPVFPKKIHCGMCGHEWPKPA